jgi:hypothetical protein
MVATIGLGIEIQWQKEKKRKHGARKSAGSETSGHFTGPACLHEAEAPNPRHAAGRYCPLILITGMPSFHGIKQAGDNLSHLGYG